jgi:hypothetical protein
MKSTRCYEVCTGYGHNRKILCWGLSRFGEKHDGEMQKEIFARAGAPGSGRIFCVTFTPGAMPRQLSPEKVAARRIRNMKARAAKIPLLAPVIEQEEMKRAYFSVEAARSAGKKRRAFLESLVEKFWKQHPEETRITLPPNAPD